MNIKIFNAFSRDGEDKVYVQHRIKQKSKLVKEMLVDNESHIFLTGNSKVLPKSIDKAFVHVLTNENVFSEEEAIKFLNKLKKDNKYYIETW